MPDRLFSPFRLGPLSLANRIVSLPLYLAYPDEDNLVNGLVLDYYQEMARSGAGLVVVENVTVEPCGLGNPRTLLISEDRFIPGLARLAAAIRRHGVPAVLQIHHAGRYARRPDRIAPSAVETWGVWPRAMGPEDILRVVEAFAAGARRAREAGFDGVELHGGTGYLLPQFVSPRTNLRQDGYGGDPERRMRFPLEVVAAVRAEVGEGFPVGYRFMAEEYVPGGLTLAEALPFAQALVRAGVAYLSVMTGCYDAFALPAYLEADRREAFMAPQAQAVKQVLPGVPVIAAGRMQTPAAAERVLETGQADLVGLARILLADPLWPRKVREGRAKSINPCAPGCSFCNQRLKDRLPAYCIRWPKPRIEAFLARVGG